MSVYKIQGGHTLKGSITAAGNKNSALPCIAAALMSEEEIVLKNIPNIEDVCVMLEILKLLGAQVRVEDKVVRICASSITSLKIPPTSAEKIRASILLAGPILARCKEVTLPPPGGDIIGRRRIDTHILALRSLGTDVDIGEEFTFKARSLTGADIFLDEASVTATENVIMAASLAKGRSRIQNAASEPHVQDLCRLINSMGGKIYGIGSNMLTIDGVEKLHGAEFAIGSDFMEVGSFIGLAAATQSEITVDNASPQNLRMIALGFAKLGIQWETSGNSIHIPAKQLRRVKLDIGGMIPKIDDAPWPGFPPDLLSIVLTVATQAQGSILIHEKMFESRMFFVDKLISMGARIILCDPHRAVVSGPAQLHGAELVSPDVRAGMALLIAACSAKGASVIQNVYQIERGYENIVPRLKNLGVQIAFDHSV